jgi:hypothetical protein
MTLREKIIIPLCHFSIVFGELYVFLLNWLAEQRHKRIFGNLFWFTMLLRISEIRDEVKYFVKNVFRR